MNSFPRNAAGEDICPMCGARLGFSRLKCVECGETLTESNELTGTEDDSFKMRAQGFARVTGLFIAFVGSILVFVGAGGLWSEFSEGGSPESALFAGSVVIGLCWMLGGVLLFRCQSSAYWFVQPSLIVLIVVQLYRIDKFNVAFFTLTTIFALLCEYTRKLLREASASG